MLYWMETDFLGGTGLGLFFVVVVFMFFVFF